MALYTKIEGEVGYTVVGNPTIENGIVSNFSNSNYLKSAQAPTNITSYEIQLKFKTTAFNNRRVIGDSTTNIHSVQLCVPSNDNGTVWYGHPSSSHAWQGIQGRNAISINTWYWFKAIWTGTKVTTYISTNGKKWLEDGSYTTSTCGWDQAVAFGYDQGNTLTGSIDLNEFYIKINGQVWFGNYNYKVKIRNGSDKYIIVGSPIINQYEITNLSSSNYITTKLSYTHISTFDINIKCKLPSTDFGSKIPIVVSFGNKLILGLNASRKVYALYNNGSQGINGRTALSLNGIYYLKYTLDENKIAKVYFSTDGENYTLEGSVTLNDTNYNAIYSNSSKFQIGAWSYGHSYDSVDTIYLDESNIIINNKLIWNGIHQNINAWKIHQDNFSKYYTIVDGKLMWANPNIYLTYSANDRNGYFDTGIYGNLNTEIQCKIIRDSVTNRKSLWGYGSSTDVPNTLSMYSDGKANCRFGNKTTPSSLSLPMNEEIIIKQNKNALYFNGTSQYNYNATSTFTTTGTLLLFQVGNVTYNSFSGKLYYFKIYNNNILVRNLVPVPKGLLIGNFVVPSNGMFDIVEQKFYENKGTGNFTIGGITDDYIIEGSKLLWCNPNIYLQSNGTQYIETNHFANSGTLVEGSFQFTDTTVQQRVFGADSNDTSIKYSMSLYINGSSKFAFSCNDGKGSWISSSITKDTNRHTYKLGYSLNYFYMDGSQTVAITGTQNNTAIQSLTLSAEKNVDGTVKNYAKIKQYKFIIYQNNNIIQYLLPVNTGMTINGFAIPAPGMWDAVTKTFYPNKGTGTFTYGKDE